MGAEGTGTEEAEAAQSGGDGGPRRKRPGSVWKKEIDVYSVE